jgi:hypothetical protein
MRLEENKFKPSLGNIVRPILKKKKGKIRVKLQKIWDAERTGKLISEKIILEIDAGESIFCHATHEKI